MGIITAIILGIIFLAYAIMLTVIHFKQSHDISGGEKTMLRIFIIISYVLAALSLLYILIKVGLLYMMVA